MNDCSIPPGSKPPREAYRDLERKTGLSRGRLHDAFERVMRAGGLKAWDNTCIDPEGNVYDAETGENLGNIVDEAHG